MLTLDEQELRILIGITASILSQQGHQLPKSAVMKFVSRMEEFAALLPEPPPQTTSDVAGMVKQ